MGMATVMRMSAEQVRDYYVDGVDGRDVSSHGY